MSDRIDTDAKPSDLRAWLTFHDLDATEARRMALALLDDRETLRGEVEALHASKEALIRKLKATQDRLAVVAGALSDHDLRRFYYGKCQEVDALRSREVPDGHVRIDGNLYRLEEGHAPRRSVNRRLVPVEEP